MRTLITLREPQTSIRPLETGVRAIGRSLWIAGLVIFGGLVPLMPTNELKVDASLAAVVILALAAYLLLRGGQRWSGSPLDRPGVAFLVVAIAATIFSVEPFLSLVPSELRGEGLIMTAAYVAVALAAARIRPREARAVLIVLLAAGAVIGAVAVGQYYGVDVPRMIGFQPVSNVEYLRVAPATRFGYSFGTRAYATLGNPVFLGGYTLLLLPLSLGTFLWGSGRRWGYVLSSTLLYAALLASQTRAAWVGALAAGAVLGAALVSTRGPWKRAAAMAAILATVTVVMVTSRPEATLGGRAAATFRSSDAALAERLYLWKHTLPMIAQRPLLGWGYSTLLGRFPDIGSEEYQRIYGWNAVGIDTPHNELLHVAYSIGLLGLAAYLWFLVGVGRSLRRAFARHEVRPLAVSLISAFVGYAIWLQLAWNLIGPANVFWLLGGLAAALHRGEGPSVENGSGDAG